MILSTGPHQPSVVVHVHKPSSWEAEAKAEGSGILSHRMSSRPAWSTWESGRKKRRKPSSQSACSGHLPICWSAGLFPWYLISVIVNSRKMLSSLLPDSHIDQPGLELITWLRMTLKARSPCFCFPRAGTYRDIAIFSILHIYSMIQYVHWSPLQIMS